jgi:hypothetical protein
MKKCGRCPQASRKLHYIDDFKHDFSQPDLISQYTKNPVFTASLEPPDFT